MNFKLTKFKVKNLALLILMISQGATGIAFRRSTTLPPNKLTVSSGGETGVSGTNWSISSNVLTITGNADINASVISSHLASNNLSLSGVENVSVNAAISWSSNSTLILNASQNILINSDITASGSSPKLYIYYGGSDASTAPNNTFIYALSQKNRNKISFSSSSAELRVGNETYSVCMNLSQLTEVMNNATGSTRVALGASINLSQTYSNSLFPINFQGKFDGLGQVIDGLKIRNSGGTSVKADLGLFSQLQGATVRNIGITNIDILTNSTIADITGSEFRIGALAGNIGNSSLTTTGYSASAYTCTIESVWSSGNIGTANNFSTDGASAGDRQKFFFAGGLVGSVNNGTADISRCYSYCNVSSSGSYTENIAIGGLIGDVGKNSSIPLPHDTGIETDMILNLTRSFTTGSVLSGTYNGYYGTGGVIGVLFVSGSTVSNCYSWGSAVSEGSFGGLVGYAAGGTITTSYTTQSTLGSISGATESNNYFSVTGTSPTTGTTLPIGFSDTVWSKVSGEPPVLVDLETPPTILYIKVTSGESSSCGNIIVNYTVTDASGTAVTLNSLGLADPSGTPVFTINNLTPPGTYNAVSYLFGLTLTGANAANYTLNPFPLSTQTHTITGSCLNYQVTFNGNNNTAGTAPANITFSSSTAIPDQGTLVLTGSTFIGWNTAANGSGTSYPLGASYSTASNLTLYAQWGVLPLSVLNKYGGLTADALKALDKYGAIGSGKGISHFGGIIDAPLPPDGSTAAKAGLSALQIKTDYPSSADGVYWIDVPVYGPKQTYCLMNNKYNGGGWMLAMKATQGTTFNYEATYWTSANTLNPTDITLNNSDAKYDIMNGYLAKDMMALWPDIIKSGTEGSGSIDNLTQWSWLENNFHNSGAKITLIAKFAGSQDTYYTATNGSMSFSGYNTSIFSKQEGFSFYGINYSGNVNAKVRWGFAWNNEPDELSNDNSGGIGMSTSYGNYSAGDRYWFGGLSTSGINRSARVELYIR